MTVFEWSTQHELFDCLTFWNDMQSFYGLCISPINLTFKDNTDSGRADKDWTVRQASTRTPKFLLIEIISIVTCSSVFHIGVVYGITPGEAPIGAAEAAIGDISSIFSAFLLISELLSIVLTCNK